MDQDALCICPGNVSNVKEITYAGGQNPLSSRELPLPRIFICQKSKRVHHDQSC
jgi:hypothetical protein